jgi:type I restriction enzyme, S subunit
MSDWREVTLGEALDVHHGFAFKGQYFREDGDFIVLTPGNFFDQGGFKPKSGKEKYYEGPFPSKYLLGAGDVVVAMTEQVQGLLGSTATIPEDSTYLHNQRIGLLEVTDHDKLDLRFAYHLMNAPSVRRQLQATATGAKIRHTAPERIKQVRAAVPEVGTQRKVAAILDCVDDLIKNNRRRVQLLVEMARAIYREWFVQFRYPGHEDAIFVDSPLGTIPENWGVRRLGDVIELRYGKSLKKEERRGGTVAVLGSSGVVGWHDEAFVSGPAVIVGRKGNVGSITWVDGDSWPIDTTYYVVTELPLRYVVEQLRLTQFLNTHAAVPGLSREQAYSRPFLLPEKRVMDQFAAVSEDLASEGSALRTQLEHLASIRDLLLPRLMSGKIDVSSLDLGTLAEGLVA